MRKVVINIFKFIILVLFLLFLGLYITQAAGYYEFKNNKKNTLTENAIKRFEQDIKEGKEIEVKDYIEEEKNYNNNLSTISLKLSNSIDFLFNKLVDKVFNDMNDLVNS